MFLHWTHSDSFPSVHRRRAKDDFDSNLRAVWILVPRWALQHKPGSILRLRTFGRSVHIFVRYTTRLERPVWHHQLQQWIEEVVHIQFGAKKWDTSYRNLGTRGSTFLRNPEYLYIWYLPTRPWGGMIYGGVVVGIRVWHLHGTRGLYEFMALLQRLQMSQTLKCIGSRKQWHSKTLPNPTKPVQFMTFFFKLYRPRSNSIKLNPSHTWCKNLLFEII